jgi:cell division protein FtsZ
MIPYHRSPQPTLPNSAVKIIGLGGAGVNMLERVALDGTEGAELLALNTDARTLSGCVAGEKIQLGRNLTKGLGAGGDPELGHQAMLEAEAEIRTALRGRRIVFLCVGLGGGTGSGAAPVITRIAREEGAFVVVFATMPFAFEGRRRREQAETTLNELAVLANALVTFDNNRMGELVLAKQGIHEAFAAADHMICESIKAVIRLVVRPGLINIGLDDLMSALRTNRSRCLFGSGLAKGKDRASCALRNALASPLLDQGALLKTAQTVLVHLSGGEDLTLYEVELLMQRLQKFVPESAQVLFGAVIDPAMGDSLSVTLISALPEDSLASAPRDTLSAATPDAAPTASVAVDTPVPAPTLEPGPARDFSLDQLPAAPVPLKPRRSQTAEADVPSLFAAAEPEAEPEAEPDAEPAAEPAITAAAEAPGAPEAEPHAAALTDSEPPPAVEPAAATAAAAARIPNEPAAFVFRPIARSYIPPNNPWGKPAAAAAAAAAAATAGSAPAPPADPAAPSPPAVQPDPFVTSLDDESEPEPPKLKLGLKSQVPQHELAFDSTPRGRFEGQTPNVVDGEDLDLPPFLRKKK